MSSIRVCVVSFDWYPFLPRVLRLVQAAVDAGYTVDVICLHRLKEKYYEVHNGATIYRMPMSRGYGLSLPITILSWCWFLLLTGATLTWLHLRHPYDVIQVHNIPDFLVFCALIPKLLGAKIILDVEDVSPELMGVKAQGSLRVLATHLATWQERISTAFADHVITVGWPFEKLLLQRGVPPEKLTIILNSADTTFFPTERRKLSLSADSKRGRPFLLMYHGTLAKRNSLDVAIRALALARRVIPELQLDIQGQGEELPALKRLVTELGVSEHTVFSDPCPPEKIVDFVMHGDIGIIPYPCDGFMELVLPTKAYEYALMCRPMIASNTPAISSLFRPESIVLCEPSNPESFAEAIIDLYNHPEKRECMVAHAAEDYLPYRWELISTRYQRLLASLSCKQAQEQPSIISSDALKGQAERN
jgi:glycosyltransferase involved in cell wall biosynthesis